MFEVTIFERRSEVAGIWNLNEAETNKFPTPMYNGLETNVPRTMMTFKDFPYPQDAPLFPTHDYIKRYLEDYAEDICEYIRFDTEVKMISRVTEDYVKKWRVDTENESGEEERHFFTAVVVATGTFDKFFSLQSMTIMAGKSGILDPSCIPNILKDLKTSRER